MQKQKREYTLLFYATIDFEHNKSFRINHHLKHAFAVTITVAFKSTFKPRKYVFSQLAHFNYLSASKGFIFKRAKVSAVQKKANFYEKKPPFSFSLLSHTFSSQNGPIWVFARHILRASRGTSAGSESMTMRKRSSAKRKKAYFHNPIRSAAVLCERLARFTALQRTVEPVAKWPANE
jgi:hypothetical protein